VVDNHRGGKNGTGPGWLERAHRVLSSDTRENF